MALLGQAALEGTQQRIEKWREKRRFEDALKETQQQIQEEACGTGQGLDDLKGWASCWVNLGRALCLCGIHTGGGTLLNGQQLMADPGWRRALMRGKSRGGKEQKLGAAARKGPPYIAHLLTNGTGSDWV